MEASRQSLYADPAVYDILHAPGTAAEVDALERIERALGSPRKRRLWFEPACGTGRYLRVAAGRGRRVAGFDLSPDLLAYAGRRLPRGAKLYAADMTDFAAGMGAGVADFAFNPVNSLRHLPSDAAMLAHLAGMRRVLKPGALYVVGISLTDYAWLFPEEDVWTGARGRCRVTQVVNYLPPEPGTRRARLETVVSHLTVTRPRGDEHFDDAYDLRCYDAAQWRRLIRRSELDHAGSFDAWGRPLGERRLPYQLEALRCPGGRS